MLVRYSHKIHQTRIFVLFQDLTELVELLGIVFLVLSEKVKFEAIYIA